MDAADPKVLELAFRLLPAAQELTRRLSMGGQPEAELVSAVSQRLKEITNGFSPELEFMAAVNWLGRTLSINRIDQQTPLPRCHSSTEELKIPDLLCIALVDGRPFPCLIEVKRNWKGKKVSYGVTRLRREVESSTFSSLEARTHLDAYGFTTLQEKGHSLPLRLEASSNRKPNQFLAI